MAVQETRTLPAPFIEGLGKDYATELKGLYQKPIDTKMFQPGVAPQHQLQTQIQHIEQKTSHTNNTSNHIK